MYTCNICQHGYSTPYSLGRHVQNIHVGRGAPGAPGAPGAVPGAPNSLHLADGSSHHFLHPFTMTVSGPTGSGKTYFVKSMLEQNKISPSPDKIIYLYKRWQPLYDKMKKTIP